MLIHRECFDVEDRGPDGMTLCNGVVHWHRRICEGITSVILLVSMNCLGSLRGKRKLKTYEYVGTFHLWQLILHFPRCPVALVQTLWRKKRLDRQILGTHVCT